ncbi:NAD-dependent deacetylase [Aeromicrobium sp. CF4.19]|uniref:SIR2 family NAD-dependent protein deacylase n=1 Tax=Aeromicrobium sp. CF4.19 TaxID=3373082 RepID=UPI003EE81045
MTISVPDDVLDVLAGAERVAVLTGAGMSAESGLATFRAPESGLWYRFRPEELATPQAWEADRPLVWAWYQWRTARVLGAEPNAGHRALTGWSAIDTVITQNVDDLHERAGSSDVLHLHGSLLAPRCEACGSPATTPPPPADVPERVDPPRCDACGAAVRPGVVWFGEQVPAIDAAVEVVRRCDALIVVGTSGSVHPAAGLADLAHGAGADVVEVNPEADPASGHVAWRTTAAVGLPALVAAVAR